MSGQAHGFGRVLVLTAIVALALPGSAPAASAGKTHTGRTQAGGTELWLSRYDGPARGRDDVASEIAVNSTGTRVFVSGWSVDRTNYLEFATAAYNGAGDQLWVTRLDQYYSQPFGLALSPDGMRVFVTGVVNYPTGNYATVAYDAVTGAQLWYVEYGLLDKADIARAIGVSPDGSRVFVTGEGGSTNPLGDYTTIAYDAATGDQLWLATYDGPDDLGGGAVDLHMAPDGSRLYVTGTVCTQETGEDYGTVTYDATTGTQIWDAIYAGPRVTHCPWDIGDRPESLALSRDGTSIYVTGTSPGVNVAGDIATVAYDAATGTQRWVKRYAVKNSNIGASGGDVGVSPNGKRVFVTGSIPTPTFDTDYVTICYSSVTGKMLWLASYDGPASDVDHARAIGAGADGTEVFVTGWSTGLDATWDYATLAYDASTGAQLWEQRYAGTGSGFDQAWALTVGPYGVVYVTGGAYDPDRGGGYVTIAYSP
jgi:hypothetical protein